MSEHKEHITRYSATDIQQYLQGKLSAAEMHAMEKAALDDPFLADAIEGMDQALKEHDETLITAKLQEAKQEIINRTTKKSETAPVVAFRWWKVAAAAAVLIIGTVWMYNALDTKNQKARDVAAVQPAPTTAAKESIAKTDSVVPDAALMNQVGQLPVSDSITVSSNLSADEKKTDKFYYNFKVKKPVTVNPDIVLSDLSKTKKDDSFTARSFSLTKDSPVHIDVSRDFVQLAPPTAPAKQQQQARKMEEITLETGSNVKLDSIKTRAELKGTVAGITFEQNKNQNYISGRVINENNMPMANASLYIQNYRSNYITDKSGYFKIPKDDSVLDVSVAATGYPTQRFVLQNNALAYNQLQLQSQNQFMSDNNLARERVSVKRKELSKLGIDNQELEQLAKVMVQEAEPVYGWVAYEKYLIENKRMPSGNARTGDVVVSFKVGKKGELSDYRIEQSLSKTYDAEAIRLIKDGPRWKSVNGRKSRITIIVRF